MNHVHIAIKHMFFVVNSNSQKLFYRTCWNKIYETFVWAKKVLLNPTRVCEQQRCRPACASTQSSQRICFSLIEKYHIQTCYKRNVNFLACLCSWAGWFEHDLVDTPMRISYDEDHMSHDITWFPTMWYVWPAKPQISLRICAVWSEPLLVTRIFYEC